MAERWDRLLDVGTCVPACVAVVDAETADRGEIQWEGRDTGVKKGLEMGTHA